MVTFRFYLVSIVAFFLALAVGVVVGSVLDEGISRSLKDRLESVEANLDDTVAAIDEKNTEIDELSAYAEASAPFAVAGSVAGTTTLVVAEPGLAKEPVEDLVFRLRQGGSHVEGIVWLEPRWDLADADDAARLAELLGTPDASADKLRDAVWAEVLAAAATDGSTVPGSTAPGATSVPGSTVPGATTVAGDVGDPVALFASPLLTSLEEAGLVRLVRLEGDDGAGGASLQVVAVTGTDSTLEVQGSAATSVVEGAAEAGLPAVLAEQFVPSDDADAPGRGELVAAARESSTVRFSSVDDLDLLAGRVAAVLALADLRAGVAGHYGYGPDVEGVLPRWLGP